MNSLNILVVDGEEILRNAIEDTLKRHNHNAFGVGSVDDFQDVFHEFFVDIYIINKKCPEECEALITRLREMAPNARVILLTAENSIDERIRAYKCGVDACLERSINLSELLACIDSLARRIREKRAFDNEMLFSLNLRKLLLSGPAGSQLLSVKEARVLGALIRSHTRMIEHWQIAELIGIDIENMTSNNIAQRMVRLRKKLLAVGINAPAIRAINKNGYFLSEFIHII